MTEINAANGFSYGPYVTEFGSWSNALESAGFALVRAGAFNRDAKKQTILDDIRQVAQELDHIPMSEEYEKHGKFAKTTLWRNFHATWENILVQAGVLTTETDYPYTNIYTSIPQTYIKYSGVKVLLDSSYEYRFAKVLDSLGVTWLCHAEMKPIRYTTPDGKIHNYHPDFYVNDWDAFLDTKGWFNEPQQAKVAAIRASHPTMTLIIVTKPLLEMYERCIKQPLLPFQ